MLKSALGLALRSIPAQHCMMDPVVLDFGYFPKKKCVSLKKNGAYVGIDFAWECKNMGVDFYSNMAVYGIAKVFKNSLANCSESTISRYTIS